MEQDNHEKNEGKSKGTRFVKPQPGKFPVKQKVVMEHTPGEEGQFVHDPEVLTTFSDVITSRMHPFEEEVSNDPQTFEAFGERIYRFNCMVMAKKLATALSEDQSLRFGGSLSRIAKVPIYSPSALVQVYDSFGAIEYEKARFSMIGQPILAFTYFARAVLNDIEMELGNPAGADINRRTALFLNLAWDGAKQQLWEYCKAVINAWAQNAPPADFNFGNGVQIRMTIPALVQNAAAYSVFTEAVPKSPTIVRHLRIAAFIEPIVMGNALTAAQRADLAGLGVGVVSWSSANITGYCDTYSTDVESRVRMAFVKGANFVPVNMMKTRGSGGQLLQKGTEHIFYSPIMLGGDVLDIGWLVAGSGTYVRTNSRACHMIPPSTTRQGMVAFLEGMLK